jgi:hypothetical protein
MFYDLYPGVLFTLQYKGYLMVGMELTIANKNVGACHSMPFLVSMSLFHIHSHILSCHPILPV